MTRLKSARSNKGYIQEELVVNQYLMSFVFDYLISRLCRSVVVSYKYMKTKLAFIMIHFALNVDQQLQHTGYFYVRCCQYYYNAVIITEVFDDASKQ